MSRVFINICFQEFVNPIATIIEVFQCKSPKFFIAKFVPVSKISDPWFKFFKSSLYGCYCHRMEIR